MRPHDGVRAFERAREDFRHARRQAAMEQVLGSLTGRGSHLLPFDEVREALHGKDTRALGLQEVPLDAIVGSVGRYRDFSRRFLPRRDSGAERWARIKALSESKEMPPISLYKIGDAYFVLDGNHRVSIARQRKDETIRAHVTEVLTPVPLSARANVDEVIRMAEYADFLKTTALDVQRPEANLLLTLPGRYPRLLRQIEAHHQRLDARHEGRMTLPEAAADWYDTIYLPAVELIREHRMLRDFPDRTEADLFLWIEENREALGRELGRPHEMEASSADTPLGRVGGWLQALLPGELRQGPQPGSWRARKQARADDALFERILVAVSGEPDGWSALELAIHFAARERGRLMGLHVEPTSERLGSYHSQVAQSEFLRRTQARGIEAEFAIAVGEIVPTIGARARGVDLIVAPLLRSNERGERGGVSAGFRSLVRRCGRPILAVPPTAPTPSRALLAYDGSPKAREALFIATYLAERWTMPLHVVTVETAHTPATREVEVRQYLAQLGIDATYSLCQPPIAEALLRAREFHDADLIIMGGYGYGVVRAAMLGSAVNGVLEAAPCAVMICR